MEEKLIQRLESAVARLEALSSPAGGGGGDAAETDPSIVAFDGVTAEYLARVTAAAAEIGGQVAEATDVLAEAFAAQRELLVQIKHSQLTEAFAAKGASFKIKQSQGLTKRHLLEAFAARVRD